MPTHVAAALGVSVLLTAISAIYFRRARDVSGGRRVAASAHAALIAALLPYGLAVDAATPGNAPTVAQLPILVFLLLAAASTAYSVWLLRDKPLLHLLHLVVIVSAVPLTFIAAVAVGGWT